MENGYSANFITAFYGNQPIQERIESFKYTSSEDDEDTCEITIEADDRNAPDLPEYQEGAVWTVIWGFIKGAKSHVRKIYLSEVKWEFTDQKLIVNITFYEKGLTLKQRNAKSLFNDTNIIDILHNAGKVHGLKTTVEIPGVNGGPPIKIITTDELQKSLKAFAAQQKLKQEQEIQLFGNTNASLIDNPSGGFAGIQIETQGSGLNFTVGLSGFGSVKHNVGINIPGQTNITGIDQELVFRELIRNFGMYANIAQGNKTDKQLLDELGKRQPGGQFILDTTDDEATLKKRNFNQKPIRTYTWANGNGELQSFEPESKGKSKDGTSINMNYDGWDKTNKTYFNGDANVTNPSLTEKQKETLAKFQKQYDAIKFTDPTKILGYKAITLEAGLKADATNRVQIIRTPVTMLNKQTALKNTIEAFTDPNGMNKSINDPTSNSPIDAGAYADNLRDEANLKNNPGYFEAFGDPIIMKGKIITILAVSKKYSGNYYITSIEHSMGDAKPYMIRANIVRQGHNIKTNDHFIANTEAGIILNKSIGNLGPAEKNKTLSIKTNPSNGK